MTDKYNKCLSIILKNEGGYVNDPQDPGGETNFGIAKKSFPELDIKALTRDEAAFIYFDKYWSQLGFEDVNPDLLALHMFDMAVNAGSKVAVKMVQSLLKIQKDGVLGPDTLKAINSYCMPQRLANAYIEARRDFYKGLSESKPGLQKFLRGWINRVQNTKFEI